MGDWWRRGGRRFRWWVGVYRLVDRLVEISQVVVGVRPVLCDSAGSCQAGGWSVGRFVGW